MDIDFDKLNDFIWEKYLFFPYGYALTEYAKNGIEGKCYNICKYIATKAHRNVDDVLNSIYKLWDEFIKWDGYPIIESY